MKYKYLIAFYLMLINSVTAQENLVENGGFEQYENNRFTGWNFDRYLSAEAVTNDVKSGNYAVKIYAVGGSFRTSKQGDFGTIKVEEGAKYTFAYWCKGQRGNENFQATITWYDQTNTPLSKRTVLVREWAETDWTEYTYEITAPTGAVKAGIGLYIPSRSGGSLIFDDVSFVLKEAGNTNVLNPPVVIESKNFQREIELSWNKDSEATAWDVVINDKEPVRTDRNSFFIEKLQPQTTYEVKVRTVKDNSVSQYSPIKRITTESMSYQTDDIERVPYLRTIDRSGNCPQTISLYYNDLIPENTQITYFIDGKSVNPDNNTLTFPKKGNQTLKIIIKETESRQWELQYKLNIQ